MNKGIHLTLMVGPQVPVPVTKVVLDALTGVQVTIPTEGHSGFDLTFTLSNRSPLHTMFLISGSNSIPMVRVIIVVTVNGTSEVLIDGVMTDHEITPGTDPGHSTLKVIGEDLKRVMDYVDQSGIPYDAMSAKARVESILKKYAFLGIEPDVKDSEDDVSTHARETPSHQGTDLAYIQHLACRVGHVFYIDPGPEPKKSIAYWGPKIKSGEPQKALNINMDAYTNVESLSFNFDSQSRIEPVLLIQENETQIPIPDITPLNPLLGSIQPALKKIERIIGAAKLTPLRAKLLGNAEASRSADAVTGNGTLDVLRYGRILKARQNVVVRGAGNVFDGLYFVDQVTHNIKRGEYKQNFSLVRNSLVANVPGEVS